MGPALLSGISILEEAPIANRLGSMVIVCTDGLANVGLGNLDIDEKKPVEGEK